MQGTPRTLPPWVHSPDEDDLPDLPVTPDHARLAVPCIRGANPKPDANRGRKLDHARSAEIVTISRPISESATRWKDFMMASEPSRPSTNGTIVDESWMKSNWPYNFDDPYQPHQDPDPVGKGFWLFNPKKRRKIRRDGYKQLMNNPFVPLLFRLTVLTFSVLALGLAGSLFQSTSKASEDDNGASCRRLSSTYMAIAFDAVAIVYIVYITVDEPEPVLYPTFFNPTLCGSPSWKDAIFTDHSDMVISLLNPKLFSSAKMRLMFFDLIFIVFNSANLALAFESLFDSTWACLPSKPNTSARPVAGCDEQPFLCHKQKALSGTLVIALVAWLVTFAISTLRSGFVQSQPICFALRSLRRVLC